MVKRFLQLIGREISGLHEAAYLLASFALLSQLLGFLRDRMLAAQFGAGEALDVYYAAFRIPDFIFIWSASMVSLSVLIPFLNNRLSRGRDEARRFLDQIFSVFFLCMAAASAAAFAAAPLLVGSVFPGFTAAAAAQTTLLMRIMLLQPLLLGISNLFASITQLERRFFIYALSPVLYNAGIIAGIFFFYPRLGLAGLSWGVVLGALLHLLVQLPTILKSGLMPRFTLKFQLSEIKKVALISLPRTLALSSQNIAVLALVSLGSALGAGSIAVFNLAWNLQSVPLAIVGASYSLAAFPTLSFLWVGGDRGRFLETLSVSLRHIIWWSLPALSLFVVLRAQIVRVVLGSGAFGWNDTRLVAACLALFALSIVAQSITLLLTRAYYAAGRTRAPLFLNVAGALGIVMLAFAFYKLFAASDLFRFFLESLLRVGQSRGTTVLVLPLAYSAGVIASAFCFWLSFSREFGRFPAEVSRTFWQSFAASVIMGAVSYLLLNVFDDVFNLRTALGVLLQGIFSGLGGLLVGVAVLLLLGNVEVREIWKTLHRKIWKAKVIGADQTETTF